MEDTVLFHHPCNLFISGPSGSGKTQWVKKLIEYKDELFDIIPERVTWCYKEWQSAYASLKETMPTIRFIEGIPENEEDIVDDISQPHLVIFDDMLGEKDEEHIKLWFTRKGHHRNASVIYITQNLFQQSKASRTLSLNAHYMILFQNFRDKGQIKTLATQTQLPHLLPAYEDAISRTHGYLIIDFHSKTPEMYRLRTDVFHRWRTADERGPVVYTR